ncbi:DUF2177 family protein [Candidatus Parcubacteria bacterium]|nr:DUF2177 family protein [Candidatus Parcubacteria bacterium]
MFKNKILLYLSVFGAFLLVDFTWIIFGANPLYQAEVGEILAESFRIVPAFLAYIGLVAGLFIFAINPSYREGKFFKSIVLGSLFGVFAYAIFALTNLAVIDVWTWKVAITDIVWGGVIGAIVGGIGYKLSVAFLR